MLLRPRRDDHLVIGKYTGKIIIGIGLLMVIPLVTSAVLGEWDTVLDFAISIALCMAFGYGTQIFCRTERDLSWSHGLVVASGSWIVATILGAMPHWLSGHEGSYLDAMFDVMSGYTTTGLYMLQDLDHIAHGLNMWRHLLTYAGGQGIVVIALTFLFKGTAGAYKLYVGEGKDERLLPNVVQTARAIWLVSLTWLLVGTAALTITGLILGQEPLRALLHGLWVYMGAWSTGGFAPQSYNTFYYHALSYEVVSIVIMIAGSFNFALHWAVWTGKKKEILRNVETVSFAITLSLTVLIATFALAKAGVYPDAMSLFRKAFYQLASGHTTTGFSTVYARAFVTQWGPIGLMATTIAMAIGASACSTGGGIKGIRMGVMFKAFTQDIRRAVSPERAIIPAKFHHIRDVYLDDGLVRTTMTITIAYVALYGLTAIVGTLYGYDFLQAAFEGVSAASNTGLSCGVTSPSMPDVMKVLYIGSMWLGRLEFMSVFALGGYIVTIVRGALMSRRFSRSLAVGILLGLMLLAGGCKAAGTPEPSPNVSSSSDLVESPKEFDGTDVAFEGEAIGEAMVRGEMAWLHINDDAYYVKNVEEGAQLGGYNTGMAVWIPAEAAEAVTYFGDYKHEGDIISVEGVYNAACAEHGGDMDIHAVSLEVLQVGHEVVDPIHPGKVIWAAALAVLALGLYLIDRYWTSGSEAHRR